MSILKKLSLMLDDVAESSIDISNIRIVNEATRNAKSNLDQLQYRLNGLIEHQLIDLAIRTKREYPSFNIAIDNSRNSCKIGSRNRVVECSLKDGKWSIRSNDPQLQSLFLLEDTIKVKPNKAVCESVGGIITLNGRSTNIARLDSIRAILEEKYAYSSTQFNIPEREARLIRKIAEDIDEDDLADDGIEDTIHVTVKYGIHTESADVIKKIVADVGPVMITIGKTSLFENDQDVLKLDVISDDLHKLNRKISKATECTDTHPDYKPHITIAYLKSGTGKKYKNDDTLSGVELSLNKLTFSSKSGQKTEINLSK